MFEDYSFIIYYDTNVDYWCCEALKDNKPVARCWGNSPQQVVEALVTDIKTLYLPNKEDYTDTTTCSHGTCIPKHGSECGDKIKGFTHHEEN